MTPPPQRWWEAPPLNLTPKAARRAALDLLGTGAPFNACQIDFLWHIALRRRSLVDRHQRIMACLTALAAYGRGAPVP